MHGATSSVSPDDNNGKKKPQSIRCMERSLGRGHLLNTYANVNSLEQWLKLTLTVWFDVSASGEL